MRVFIIMERRLEFWHHIFCFVSNIKRKKPPACIVRACGSACKNIDSVTWEAIQHNGWRLLECWHCVAVEWGNSTSWLQAPGGCLPCCHQNILDVGRSFQCSSLLLGLLRRLASPGPCSWWCCARRTAEKQKRLVSFLAGLEHWIGFTGSWT